MIILVEMRRSSIIFKDFLLVKSEKIEETNFNNNLSKVMMDLSRIT